MDSVIRDKCIALAGEHRRASTFTRKVESAVGYVLT